jgi:hypothetical protein
MNNSDKEDEPRFGYNLGIWYPLIWKILGSNRWWSPAMWLPRKSGLAIDIYLGIWWVLEVLAAILCACVYYWRGIVTMAAMYVLVFRVVDIIFVLLSILVKGFYRRSGAYLSSNRIVALVLLNALETMFIFAVFFRGFGILYPCVAGTEPALESFFHALYFSVITGTTVGYGNPSPTGWVSQLLAIVETLIVLLIVIGVIGYVAGGRKRPVDTEKESC